VTKRIRIPASCQIYLDAVYDAAQDKFDIVNYACVQNETFPAPWAYWKMEETSGTRIDSTGNDRHLTLEYPVYDPAYDTGILGNAVKFIMNQMDAYVLWIDNGLSLGEPQQFTVAFWFKGIDITPGDNSLLEIVLGSGPVIDIWDSGNATNCAICIYARQTADIDTEVTLDWTDWHLFILEYDGTNLKLYLDNALIATTGIPNYYDFPYDITITGGSLQGSGVDGDCYIDEMGIWLLALTADQRDQLWNGGAGWSPY